MRIVSPAAEPLPDLAPRPWTRAPNLEAIGLAAVTFVVVLGVVLTSVGRVARLRAEGHDPAQLLRLDRLRSPAPLEPLLPAYEDPFERRAVARALYARATGDPALEHVGGLAGVAMPAAAIEEEPRFVVLRARLGRRPGAPAIPVLTPGDLAALKPRVAVRAVGDFRRRVLAALVLVLSAFWAAHAVRRARRIEDEPAILPALMLLCGIGLASMIALRDPVRDTIIASGFAVGVAAGVALLLAAAQVDWEGWRLRRAVAPPLGLALALAVLLLLFGSGPGSSGARVNLLGVQPVEAIRLLVILAVAAFFSRRLDLLRELSGAPAARGRGWLPALRGPRWKDVRPIVLSVALVLAFFFLQKDLGPALVMACVFLGLYGIARGRLPLAAAGVLLLACGFAAAYALGVPATVRQRVLMWADPWDNGVAGGNQIAHGLWALSTGGPWGLGLGLGSPEVVPAGHTDFVLAAIGEELGFVGMLVVVTLYGLLCWRAVRVAIRAPGDYTACLAAGIVLALAVQALVIAGGLLGLMPLAGVVTPFLSYGKSSMLANFAAIGIVLGIARRQGAPRAHLRPAMRVLGSLLAAAGAVVLLRAAWIQVPRADAFATRAALGEQADGGYRFEHNPRLVAAARRIPRGSIYDRHGLPIATSRRDELDRLDEIYRHAGVDLAAACGPEAARCYPLGGAGFHVIGDLTRQTNWGAPNSSYLERDRAARLQGFDDRAALVDVRHPRTGSPERTTARDYSELLPLARSGFRTTGATRSLLGRDRSLHASLDARLQLRAAHALRRRIEASGSSRGAAVVLDVDTGEVLASVSYPWPALDATGAAAAAAGDDAADRLLDRARYGLYPPGSVFKLVVAGAALRGDADPVFACVRLPDGRVGNYVRGSRRPVRDDALHTMPHGQVDLRRGLVVSCNAYFAQLAMRLGPARLLEASRMFLIDAAGAPAGARLPRTLPHAGYGQGEVLVSPLKMARVAAAVAAGGTVRPVRWEQGAGDGRESGTPFLSGADAAVLARYMRDAVASGAGSALAAGPVAIAGKTGTAEVAGRRAHAWFAGFAPYDGPHRIAFAVIVEHAGYGARTAAPVAGEIVAAAHDLGLFRTGEDLP